MRLKAGEAPVEGQRRAIGHAQPFVGQIADAALEVFGEVFQDVGLLERAPAGFAGVQQLAADQAVDGVAMRDQLGGHVADRAGDDVAVLVVVGGLRGHLDAAHVEEDGRAPRLVEAAHAVGHGPHPAPDDLAFFGGDGGVDAPEFGPAIQAHQLVFVGGQPGPGGGLPARQDGGRAPGFGQQRLEIGETLGFRRGGFGAILDVVGHAAEQVGGGKVRAQGLFQAGDHDRKGT